MMIYKNPTEKSVTLHSEAGVSCMSLAPKQERTGSDSFMKSALSKGIIVNSMSADDSTAPAAVAAGKTFSCADIIEAIKVVMASGDVSKLTDSGKPRVKEVEAVLGGDITSAQLAEAFKIYSATDGDA